MQRRPLMTLLPTLLTLGAHAGAASAPTPADLRYGGTNFNALAAESYTLAGQGGQFTDWLNAAYQKAGLPLAGGKTLIAGLDARRAELRAAKGAEKDRLARDTATWAHTFIKKVVPKFSLERGYEFASIPKTGERQCLLQSTIIAGLLQRAGLDAGLVMVWKSQSGQESNLGHVTSVLRLPSGAGDVEVDASEPDPTATHSGLLAWVGGGYRFVEARFGADHLITGYARSDGQGTVKPAALTFLSLNYVRSQFDYYRGERATGGVLGTGTGKATPAGLASSERFLRRALREEPANALAANVLGNVLRKEGKDTEARAQFRAVGRLYAAQGRTPAGVQANVRWAGGPG
ncbi:hypothetical protein [Deinococcus petrolearius]|uniref:Transglutaminase-like domain-containing protein n=1 Tax=Deinococcus petrolearius TaxID=1751295 RepID=A0ABW1DGI3_9DEIO